MFICINDVSFTEMYPELLDFVKDPQKNKLPGRYRIYTYLNNEGQFRKFPFAITNFWGVICELAYPPYGYVLNIDNINSINHLTEITLFSEFDDERTHCFDIGLNRYPTYYAIPLDFRDKNELKKIMSDKTK